MKNLNQLIEAVKTKVNADRITTVQELRSLVNQYRGNDWNDYLPNESKTPKTKILLQEEQVKMILVYWRGFQKTQKHGHPEGGGLLKVLTGSLKETRFNPQEPDRIIGTNHFFKGAVSYIHDAEAYHIVENPIPYPAVSLHIYIPGIYTPNILALNKPEETRYITA